MRLNTNMHEGHTFMGLCNKKKAKAAPTKTCGTAVIKPMFENNIIPGPEEKLFSPTAQLERFLRIISV